MANSVLTITHGSNSKISKNSGYGIIYGWISAEITEETATTVTVRVKAYTCGTSSSDPWRGPSWSGMNINSGMSWYEANGSYQELQSQNYAFSYNYSAVIDSYWLTKTFNKRSSEYTVNLYCDTDGSLPNLIDWTVCGTLTVGKIISYPVTYDVDGETVKTLTKYHDTPLTLDCVSPSKEGYTFLGWGSWDGTTPPTQASSDYDNGKTYTGNAELKLRAVWRKNQYDIKYYSNKPSDMTALTVQNFPSNALAKDWNTDYTIPATKPYLLEYKFLGYATSPTGNVSYQPGDQYKVLQDLTLYAQWESLYTPPTVSSVRVVRTDASGTEQDDGTNIRLTFNWSICPAKNEDSSQTAVAATPKYQVYYKKTTETGTAQQYFGTAQSLSGTSGSINTVLTAVEFEADSAYTIEVRVTESHKVNNAATVGTASSVAILTKASYIIDIANQGKRLGLGIAAPTEDGMEIAYKTTFLKTNDKNGLVSFKATDTSAITHHVGVGYFSDSKTFGIWDYNNNHAIVKINDSGIIIRPPLNYGNMVWQATNINMSTAPTSTIYTWPLLMADGNYNVFAHIGGYRDSGSAGIRIGARRGSNYCDIVLGVKEDGTPRVYMSNTTATAFKGALSFGDYVVQQATSGIWTYRKWNSGVLEAWATPSFNSGDLTWTNWSGVFKFTPIVVNFPSNLFTEAANVEATPQIQGSGYSAKLETNSKDSFTLAIIAADGVALAAQTFYVHIQAKGRWK